MGQSRQLINPREQTLTVFKKHARSSRQYITILYKSLRSLHVSRPQSMELIYFTFFSLRLDQRSLQHTEQHSSVDNIPLRDSKKCLVHEIPEPWLHPSLIKNKSKHKSTTVQTKMVMRKNEIKFPNPFYSKR